MSIQSDEATHSLVLEVRILIIHSFGSVLTCMLALSQETIQALGSRPINNCTFDFTQVLTDVTTMATVARVVENVGVTAYLGAANLLSDPVLLTAAGSILTVEARHQTILNVLNSGTAIPQAFDFAFTPNEVLALAGPFVSGCNLGITANQPLTITNNGTVTTGTLLTFSSPAINGSTNVSRARSGIKGRDDF